MYYSLQAQSVAMLYTHRPGYMTVQLTMCMFCSCTSANRREWVLLQPTQPRLWRTHQQSSRQCSVPGIEVPSMVTAQVQTVAQAAVVNKYEVTSWTYGHILVPHVILTWPIRLMYMYIHSAHDWWESDRVYTRLLLMAGAPFGDSGHQLLAVLSWHTLITRYQPEPGQDVQS